MKIIIREIDHDNLRNINKCDAIFTVNSKLVLHATDGVIRYSVVSVESYQKQYVYDEKDYSSYISNPNKIIYFVYVDGRLAGQIGVIKHWTAYAWIDDFVVDIQFRRSGVGRAMMQQVVNWAKARRFPGIMLETQHNNVVACQFYENFGFKLYGFDTHLYKGLNPDTEEIALYWYLMF
jgi:streptothricin acetyltransferase